MLFRHDLEAKVAFHSPNRKDYTVRSVPESGPRPARRIPAPAGPVVGTIVMAMIKRDTLAFRTLVLMARQRPEFDAGGCHALLELLATAEALRSTLRQGLQSMKLSETQFEVLLVLLALDPDPLQPATLAEHSGLSRNSLGETIDQLHSLGLAERHRSPDDQRLWLISLTAAGQEVADKAAVLILNALSRLAEPLEPPAPRALLQLCETLFPGASHPTPSLIKP